MISVARLEEGDLKAGRADSPAELRQVKMALRNDGNKSIFVGIEDAEQVFRICLAKRWRQFRRASKPFSFANLSIVIGV
jgi:hypothetical protein